MKTNRRNRMGVALVLALAVLCPGAWAEDHVVVTRNVNLRKGPSSDSGLVRALQSPDILELVALEPKDGYYNVRTEDDEEGWVWSRNVRRLEADEPGPISFSSAAAAPAAAPAAAVISSAVSPDWDRPAPKVGTFRSQGKTCGPSGDGGDAETNRRKNRVDVPLECHDVGFDAIAKLDYPKAPRHRHDWSQEQLAEIGPYEGAAVRLAGYLVALKVQNKGSGESTNCHWTASSEVDWHMAIARDPGQGEDGAIVVETTPRVHATHPKWTPAALKPWLDTDAPVRISGWLLMDPEHRNHLGRFRTTLWEIHPISKIEVWNQGQWQDLDAMP